MSLTFKNLYSRTNTFRLLPRDYFYFTFRFPSASSVYVTHMKEFVFAYKHIQAFA